MGDGLELTTAREFLARALESTKRGTGHVGAGVIALPLGFLKWIIDEGYSTSGRANFYLRGTLARDTLDGETRLSQAAFWLKSLMGNPHNPSLSEEVREMYGLLKPYPLQPELTHR